MVNRTRCRRSHPLPDRSRLFAPLLPVPNDLIGSSGVASYGSGAIVATYPYGHRGPWKGAVERAPWGTYTYTHGRS